MKLVEHFLVCGLDKKLKPRSPLPQEIEDDFYEEQNVLNDDGRDFMKSPLSPKSCIRSDSTATEEDESKIGKVPLHPIVKKDLQGKLDLDTLSPFNQCYSGEVIDCFPAVDKESPRTYIQEGDLADFCFPSGLYLSPKMKLPTYHTFVLTNDTYKRTFGHCLVFYETIAEDLYDQLDSLTAELQKSNYSKYLHSRLREIKDIKKDRTALNSSLNISLSNSQRIDLTGTLQQVKVTDTFSDSEEGEDEEEGQEEDINFRSIEDIHLLNNISHIGNGETCKKIGIEQKMNEDTKKEQMEEEISSAKSFVPSSPSLISDTDKTDTDDTTTTENTSTLFDEPSSGDVDSPFGFNLLPPRGKVFVPKCICITSHFPYIDAFKVWLMELYSMSISPSLSLPIERYICNFVHEIPLPIPGQTQVQYLCNDKEIMFQACIPKQSFIWTSAPNAVETVFTCLSPETILTLFQSLLLEQQILLHSTQLSLLSNTAEVLMALLYPFKWVHVYAPVLPKHCWYIPASSPVPFLVGFATRDILAYREKIPSHVLMLDIDNDHLHVNTNCLDDDINKSENSYMRNKGGNSNTNLFYNIQLQKFEYEAKEKMKSQMRAKSRTAKLENLNSSFSGSSTISSLGSNSDDKSLSNTNTSSFDGDTTIILPELNTVNAVDHPFSEGSQKVGLESEIRSLSLHAASINTQRQTFAIDEKNKDFHTDNRAVIFVDDSANVLLDNIPDLPLSLKKNLLRSIKEACNLFAVRDMYANGNWQSNRLPYLDSPFVNVANSPTTGEAISPKFNDSILDHKQKHIDSYDRSGSNTHETLGKRKMDVGNRVVSSSQDVEEHPSMTTGMNIINRSTKILNSNRIKTTRDEALLLTSSISSSGSTTQASIFSPTPSETSSFFFSSGTGKKKRSTVSFDSDKDYNEESIQKNWYKVRKAFMIFFASLLKDYRSFLNLPKSKQWNHESTFNSKKFVSSQPSERKAFLGQFLKSQMFSSLLDNSLYPDLFKDDGNILDDLIANVQADEEDSRIQEKNQLTQKKRDGSFHVLNAFSSQKTNSEGQDLLSVDRKNAGSRPESNGTSHKHRQSWASSLSTLGGKGSNTVIDANTKTRRLNSDSLSLGWREEIHSDEIKIRTIVAMQPDKSNLQEDIEHVYNYVDGFPRLNSEFVIAPRIQNDMVSDFALNVVQNNTTMKVDIAPWLISDASKISKDPETLVCALYLVTFNAIIGREKQLGLVLDFTSESFTSTLRKSEIIVFKKFLLADMEYCQSNKNKNNRDNNSNREEEALDEEDSSILLNPSDISQSNLEMSFTILDRLKKKKVKDIKEPEEIIYRGLMDACGRTGNIDLATACLKEMHDARITPDSHTFSSFLSTMIFRKREWGEGHFTNESAQSLMKNNNSLNDDVSIAQNKVKMNKNDEEDGNESDHNQTTFDLSSMHEPIKGTGIISLLGQPNLMPPLPSTRNESNFSDSLNLCIGANMQINLKITPISDNSNLSNREYSERVTSRETEYEIRRSDPCISHTTDEKTSIELPSMSDKFKPSTLYSNSTPCCISLLYRTGYANVIEIGEDHPHFRIYSQIALGELMLHILFPDLVINLDFESCPSCKRNLSSKDIQKGWLPDPNNYTTQCPFCVESISKGMRKKQEKSKVPRRFVAYFSICSSRNDWEGSSGAHSLLICEYLSPWVLWKELTKILATDGLASFLHPDFRSSSSGTCTIFWNLIVAFRQYDLPLSFLLAPSVSLLSKSKK